MVYPQSFEHPHFFQVSSSTQELLPKIFLEIQSLEDAVKRVEYFNVLREKGVTRDKNDIQLQDYISRLQGQMIIDAEFVVEVCKNFVQKLEVSLKDLKAKKNIIKEERTYPLIIKHPFNDEHVKRDIKLLNSMADDISTSRYVLKLSRFLIDNMKNFLPLELREEREECVNKLNESIHEVVKIFLECLRSIQTFPKRDNFSSTVQAFINFNVNSLYDNRIGYSQENS